MVWAYGGDCSGSGGWWHWYADSRCGGCLHLARTSSVGQPQRLQINRSDWGTYPIGSAGLIQFGEFNRFWLRAANATPDGVRNNNCLRHLVLTDVDREEEGHWRGMFLTYEPATKTARSVRRLVAYPTISCHCL